MKFEAGQWARGINPTTQRMVAVMVLEARGKVLQYRVTDGLEEWWTFMLRAPLPAPKGEQRGKRTRPS